MQSIRELHKRDLQDKVVLLRADFNVERAGGRILDDYRIQAALPTIRLLLSSGAKPIVLSHLGRPRRSNARDSLRPVARHLSRLLGRRVIFFEEFGDDRARFLRTLPRGAICMLENLRFWPGEEKNSAAFGRKLARLGHIYVNDAFAVSHRKNASVAAITKYIPSYAGLGFLREVEMLEKVIQSAKKPLVVICGGKKVSDKLLLIQRFQPSADEILTGGGVANTFLAADGAAVGKSLVERSFFREARRMRARSGNILVPVDWLEGSKDGARAIFDIGPKTICSYSDKIARARTLIWNGPMGVFENPKFAKGSYAVARAIAKNRRALSVVGGGETVAVFKAANPKSEIRNPKLFLSTGGGAMLEYLAGKKLPGITALDRAKTRKRKF